MLDEWHREGWNSTQCMDLYGRIHARFILTARGQHLMVILSIHHRCCCRCFCHYTTFAVHCLFGWSPRAAGKILAGRVWLLSSRSLSQQRATTAYAAGWSANYLIPAWNTVIESIISLPVWFLQHGISDIVNEHSVKTFCPMCHKIFEPERELASRGSFNGLNSHWVLSR